MCIVIDLLGAQVALKDKISDRYFSELTQWISKNNIENYYFILHSKDDDTLRNLRDKLKNKKNIKTFFYFTDDLTLKNKEINSKLYLNFIKSLNPEIIIIDKALFKSNIYKNIYKNKKLKNCLFNSSKFPNLKNFTPYKNQNNKTKSKKPKLAFVSPLPPEKTGIACYSTVLAKALSAHYEITFITDQKKVDDVWINNNGAIKSSKWLLENHKAVDRILYHMGNSSFHAEMFELLKDAPGVVVMHDFFLGDALWYIENHLLAPHALNLALYNSHGYAAVKDNLSQPNSLYAIKQHPANFDILSRSIGTIFHSKYSLQLLKKCYPTHNIAAAHIPLSRDINETNKINSLAKLGYAEDDFIVASFGFIGSSKCNLELLQAWQQSSILKDKNAHLVFVGGGGSGDPYYNQFKDFIKTHDLNQVKITGFASPEMYEHYLSAADIAIQLRAISRGETSGTVLDCMAHGLPVIINQNGSMAELDPNATMQLPDQFSVTQLTEALETLYQSHQMRASIGSNAQMHIEVAHSPDTCAQLYTDAIEDFYQQKKALQLDFYSALKPSLQTLSDSDLIQLANSIAQNFPNKKAQRTLFVDVSVVARESFKTDSQASVTALTLELLSNPPYGLRIEPIYLSEVSGKWLYYSARSYSSQLLNMPDHWLADEPAEFNDEDIFLGLDFAGDSVFKAAQQGLYRHLQDIGVHTAFVVYDLTPVLFKAFYSSATGASLTEWLQAICQADTAVCSSQTASNDLRHWLEKHEPQRLADLNIQHFNLGTDSTSSTQSTDWSVHEEQVLEQLKSQPSFLMVGAVEPRNGQWQTLKAFEQLWAQGYNANLVIVGKKGELIDEFATELNQHPEFNQRLFWLTDSSEEYLSALYAASACLIAAAYCEGLGLPLIEAAKQQLPIIARDLPIFREIAQQHAFYFDSQEPDHLATALTEWISLYQADKHPKSIEVSWLTWQASTQQLLDILIPNSSAKSLQTSALTSDSEQSTKRLLIDLSATCRHDLKTGIERVARALLLAFIENPPEGYSVAPVYLSEQGGTWHYRYAYSYLANIQNQATTTQDHAVKPCKGDVILGLDISGDMLIQAAASGLFKRYKAAGVSTYFMVHDLLPISMPMVFPPSAEKGHARWLETVIAMDGAICVSQAVAKDLQEWFNAQPSAQKNPNFSIKWSHHGADVASSSPSKGLPESADTVLKQLAQRPSFVMVGTLEPRKGYLQTVQAFDRLWKQGVDVNLVIVGHEGWKGLDDQLRRDIPETAEYIRSHPELNKHLFWLEGISDEFLEKVYTASSCLIAASYGEGFGLPLIEAAQKYIPIFARDIPVFREVAGNHAHYFTADHPEKLARIILDWLELYAKNTHPSSTEMPWLTWQQSAQNLHKVLLEHAN